MKVTRPRVTAVAVALLSAALLGATALKAISNAVFDFSVPGVTNASWSSRESEAKGLLVSRLQVSPPAFEWDGFHVAIDEVWLEEAAERKHRFVWFPYYSRTGNYHLCLTLRVREGQEFLAGPDDPCFYLPGQRQSLSGAASMGRVVVWAIIEPATDWPKRICVGTMPGDRPRLYLTISGFPQE